MSVALVALLVLSVPSAPTPAEAWRDVPSLAPFMAAEPVVVDGWLAFRDGNTVVRLAPVPPPPVGAAGAAACGKLPRPEADWAGIWAFPTADPVVLHLAEEATLWQWTPTRRCWIEVPLRARGARAVPGTVTRAARREASVTLALGPLDAGLAAFTLAAASVAAAQEPAKPVMALEGDAAMVTILIKGDKTADFESVIAKYKEALAKSDNPKRKEQLAGMKFFKSPTAVQGNAMYIISVDPVVTGEEYDITRVVTEVFPVEVQEVYAKYKDSFAGRQIISLNKVP